MRRTWPSAWRITSQSATGSTKSSARTLPTGEPEPGVQDDPFESSQAQKLARNPGPAGAATASFMRPPNAQDHRDSCPVSATEVGKEHARVAPVNDSKPPRSQPPKPISQPPPAMDEFDDEWTDSSPDLGTTGNVPATDAAAQTDTTGSPATAAATKPAATVSSAPQQKPEAKATKSPTTAAANVSPSSEGASKPSTTRTESKVAASPSSSPKPTPKPEPAKTEPKPAPEASGSQPPKQKTEPEPAAKTADSQPPKQKTEPKPAAKAANSRPPKQKTEPKPAAKTADTAPAKSRTETAKAEAKAGTKSGPPSAPPSGSPDSLDRELSVLSQPPDAAEEARPAGSEWPRVDAAPLQLGDALTLDVLFGRWITSLRTVFLVSMALSAVLVGLAVLAVVRSAEKASSAEPPVNAQPKATASAPAAASASASAAASAQPTGQDLLALARAGNAKAMEALDAKPAAKRSAAEATALVRGREIRRQHELEKLGEELLLQPTLEHDHHAWRTLREFVQDPRTATDALLIIAKLPGPAGPDLLYTVWTGTRERTDASGLAQELLYGPDVRPKASRALSVALELRTAKECEQYKAILPRAIEHGDRRSLRLLGRLLKKRGCGRKKLEDCYKCLRKGKELTKAIQAVKRRDEPTFEPEDDAE